MPLQKSYRLFGRSILSLLFLGSISRGFVSAQVIPDGTLPTTVEQLGNMDRITGGERVGNNLFHSFEQFSIPEGIEAVFENGLDIENIFTRVTGSEASIIDGLLKTAGGANFFLINPSGIVFGENARLDVGGSFVASTANEVKFADGNTFAIDGNPNVTLTISVPIGLGFYGQNGEITVNGNGHQIQAPNGIRPLSVDNTEISGISVNPGRTLALIGGDVNFNGGKINVSSGRIEIGSVNTGNVNISSTDNYFNFEYGDTKGKEISFTNQALVYATEQKGFSGESPELTVLVRGENITLSNGSYILLQNENAILGNLRINANDSLTIIEPNDDATIPSLIGTQASGSAIGSKIELFGNNITIKDGVSIGANNYGSASTLGIEINASEKVLLQGARPGTANVIIGSGAFGTGKGGNTVIITPSLSMVGAAGLTSPAFGSGKGGEVTIKAETVTLEGNSISNPFISSPSFRQGGGGSITIETSKLRLANGATINSSALATGEAGSITINSAESIEILGKNDQSTRIQSSVTIPSETARNFLGIPEIPEAKAGDITITTSVLKLNNGAFIGVENQGIGNGGLITINTDNLILDEAGSITAAASSGIGGNINLNTENLNISNDSQITTAAGSNQDGGNITINTTNLSAKKNSDITANSLEGDGGNVTITNADTISLNDGSNITARSSSGNGGNITIKADQIQILNNSNLSASSEGGDGNGGNIEVTGDVVVLLDNSSITANAVEGMGGDINITADGLFVSPDSQITATSELGIDGTVTITTLSRDIEKELLQSEPYIIDIDEAIANSCLGERNRSSFVVGGTGGLPYSPDTQYRDLDFKLTGVGSLPRKIRNDPQTLFPETIKQDVTTNEIEESWIPATRAIRTKDGEIYLINSLQTAHSLLCPEETAD